MAEGREGCELTDAGEDQEDHEGVENWDGGVGEGAEYLARGAEATEETEDAKGSQYTDDAPVVVVEDERHERHADDAHVEPGPGVLHEGEEPAGEGSDGELGREDDSEEEVELGEKGLEVCARDIASVQGAGEVGLHDCADEALGRRHFQPSQVKLLIFE